VAAVVRIVIEDPQPEELAVSVDPRRVERLYRDPDSAVEE
jgi:hypothetical protein